MESATQSQHSVILTVNSRLARWLLLKHNESQLKSGGPAVWLTPEILPLTAWLKKVWVESWPEKHILNDLQTRKLWETIVTDDARFRNLSLLHLHGAAEQAAKAYALIQQYRLPTNRAAFEATEEARVFFDWMRTYKNRLEEYNALDPLNVLDHVHEAMQQGAISLPKQVTLAGFEEITPQLDAWLGFLRKQQVALTFDPEIPQGSPPALDSVASGKKVEIRVCIDRKEEAVKCARWVRANYKLGKKIGIVVPDLADYRPLLEHELKAELAPESIYPWIEKELPFNLSMGTPLVDAPMVRIALTVLSATKNDALSLPFATFTNVIKSPWFHPGQREVKSVQNFVLKLAKENIATVYLEELASEKTFSKFFKVKSKLETLILKWVHLIRHSGNNSPSYWAAHFSDLLNTLGWPGKGLSSRQYQVHETWKERLDNFASLDAITGNVSRSQAAAILSGLCKDHPFQEKTREQPIQVVGLLESAGMTFDALWVPGCHAEALPAPPNPNPYLPAAWRKKYNLPRATVERELEFARHSLARLLFASPHIVFSHPSWESNAKLRMSPLLNPLLADTPPSPLEISHRIRDQVFKAAVPRDKFLETFEEPTVLPATLAEKQHFLEKGPGGGQSVIRDQAQCPFRAFARHRLHADTEEFPDLDFDHRERGSLVHEALEIFWRETQNRAGLEQLFAANGLEEAIRKAIEEALDSQSFRLGQQERFRDLETERLFKLIQEWLAMERKREDFTVTAQEDLREFAISGLKLKLRIDRIDRLANGHTLLIDYKTGDAKPAGWFGDRPQEPQLPLYALQSPPEGIAFGQIKKGQVKFKSDLHRDAPILELGRITPKRYSCAETWEERLQAWEIVLKDTALRFVAGHTEVDPFPKNNTCKNCGLETLCRVREMAALFEGEEE